LSADFLALVAPPAYWAAAPVLAIGAAATAMSGTTQFSSLGITVAKRSGLIATGAWLTAAVNIGANLLLIPYAGATGAAIALFISFLFLTVYYFAWSQRLYPLPFHRGRIAFALLLMGGAAIIPALQFGPSLAIGGLAMKAAFFAAALAAAVALGAFDLGLLRTALKPRRANG
jgi:O-antigen/teichoic acid export membrane protein